MNHSIVGRLIAKDLYLYRWLIVGTVLAGLVALVMAGRGGPAETLGGILLVSIVLTFGAVVALYGTMAEGQSRSRLLVLSLPISPQQYTLAKLAAALIAFLVPWLVLTGTIVASTVLLDSTPNGRLPFTLAVMGCLLANFAILLSVGLMTGSELWAIVAIIGANTAVPVFLAVLLPAAVRGVDGPTPIWSPGVLAALAAEAAIVVVALGIAWLVQSRRKDAI